MMIVAATAFTISIFVLILLLALINKERRQNRRFFAVNFRSWLDKKIGKIETWLANSYDHFVKYVVQLHWYYSLHSLLKTLLKFLVAFYTYFEDIFESNRLKAKKLRAEKKQLGEKNHLQHMADHKEDTSLTPAQKKKLSQKELEGKH
jgi:hypothetical protein